MEADIVLSKRTISGKQAKPKARSADDIQAAPAQIMKDLYRPLLVAYLRTIQIARGI